MNNLTHLKFLVLLLLNIWPIMLLSQSWVRFDNDDNNDSVTLKASLLSPSARQLSWQQAEFSIFIHFGMNTYTDREWGIKGTAASTFLPTDLDAEQWVSVAREAGAKMLLLVAKHHDGFCLWPSRYTEYSVKNSPWKGGKGDVVREVSNACRKHGMKLGLYLSPWDINSPLYGTDEYNLYFKNQLRELLTGYGNISEVWFDGACGEGANGKKQVYDWAGYYRVVRELAPEAVIAVMGPDVRWVGTESGYGRETEWSVVPASTSVLDQIASSSMGNNSLMAFNPQGNMMEIDLGSREKISLAEGLIWYPSEVDVSIRKGWFYHASEDSTVKTPNEMVDIFFSSVGRNSLLLLNIPPDKRGLIHDNDIHTLQRMRKILDEIFKNPVFSDSAVILNKGVYEVDFPDARTFDILLLQEDITHGQRVENFVLEKWENDAWKEIINGTTIGYKRLLRFEKTTSGKIRLRITGTRNEPYLQKIQLLKYPETE